MLHIQRAIGKTELEERFPTHVIREWLGNTQGVAR